MTGDPQLGHGTDPHFLAGRSAVESAESLPSAFGPATFSATRHRNSNCILMEMVQL